MVRTRVSFIKLRKPEKARHLCELAEQFVEQGERVLITVNDENQGVTLDAFMWVWKKDSFVPHCLANGAVGSGRVALLAQRATLLIPADQLDEADLVLDEAEALLDEDTPHDVRRWLTAARVQAALWRGQPAAALMAGPPG